MDDNDMKDCHDKMDGHPEMHGHGMMHGHGHGHKMKNMMLMKTARDLVMRCYPEGQLTYDQVKEAAGRIHEIKHILKKGKASED